MGRNPFIRNIKQAPSKPLDHQSAGILDDHPIRKSIHLPFTEGSILFTGPSGNISEDNDNFHWDNNNKALLIGGSGTPADIKLFADGTAVFNELGNAVIHRIESKDEFNMFKLDGNLNAIGIAQYAIAGTRLSLPQETDVATPTLAFGDGDTGFTEILDDQLAIIINGAEKGRWDNVGLGFGGLTNRPGFVDEESTATNPVFIPHRGDLNTGIGGGGFDKLSLIVGGIEMMNLTEGLLSDDILFNHDKLGFFGVTVQSQQNHIVDADGNLADITTKFNTLLADLEGYGLLKTS